MQLCYCRSSTTNFGDDINSWLWHELLADIYSTNSDPVMLGIGTIIDRPTTSTFPAAKNWIVFGSGVGYGALPDFSRANWHFIAVRGPLSAQILKLDPDLAVTDGAILVADHPSFAPLPEDQRAGVVFMPHHSALAAGDWQRVCDEAGVEFLNPMFDSRAIVRKIRSARLVLADAMHAAIVADAMRVPWVPLVTSPEISSFKWLDWTLSMGLEYQPIRLPHSCNAERVRSYTLPWYGDVNQCDPLTTDAAIRSLLVKQRSKRSLTGRIVRKIARKGYSLIIKPAAAGYASRASGLKLDASYLQEAVRALQSAQNGPIYLSDDKTFKDKLNIMRERLQQVKGFVQPDRISATTGTRLEVTH